MGGHPDERQTSLLRRCQAAWPALRLPEERFLAYLAERHGPVDLAAIHVEDLYLACACAAGLPEALRSFEDRFLAQIPLYLGAAGAALAEEVQQILRIRLLFPMDGRMPHIETYAGSGTLGGWVRIAALRTASGLRRAQRRQLRREATAPLAPRRGTPEDAIFRRVHGETLADALRDALHTLPDGPRRLMRLRYLEGKTLPELATALGLSRATVVRQLAAAREQIREETGRLLSARLALLPAECESLLGLVDSQLDVSLVRWLCRR